MLFLVNPTRNTEGVHVNLMRWTDAYLGEPIGNADGVCVYMVITNGFLCELKNWIERGMFVCLVIWEVESSSRSPC